MFIKMIYNFIMSRSDILYTFAHTAQSFYALVASNRDRLLLVQEREFIHSML